MNVVKQADGPLGRAATLKLLSFIEGRKEASSIIQVSQDYISLFPASLSRVHNTILLLSSLGIVGVKEGRVRAIGIHKSEHPQFLYKLGKIISHHFCERLMDEKAVSCVRLRQGQEGLYLDSLLLPDERDKLGLWLVEFKICSRDETGSRYWRIGNAYEDEFLNCVANNNLNLGLKKFHKNTLDAILERKEILGEEAENWVLEYEKRRIKEHPLLNQVRKISNEHASAGYDILSFSSNTSLTHDLFIEVKSFSENESFFWSDNEIETAKKMKEKYALYIVDRSKISEASYKPRIVFGPYKALFETTNTGWSMTAKSYEFKKE